MTYIWSRHSFHLAAVQATLTCSPTVSTTSMPIPLIGSPCCLLVPFWLNSINTALQQPIFSNIKNKLQEIGTTSKCVARNNRPPSPKAIFIRAHTHSWICWQHTTTIPIFKSRRPLRLCRKVCIRSFSCPTTAPTKYWLCSFFQRFLWWNFYWTAVSFSTCDRLRSTVDQLSNRNERLWPLFDKYRGEKMREKGLVSQLASSNLKVCIAIMALEARNYSWTARITTVENELQMKGKKTRSHRCREDRKSFPFSHMRKADLKSYIKDLDVQNHFLCLDARWVAKDGAIDKIAESTLVSADHNSAPCRCHDWTGLYEGINTSTTRCFIGSPPICCTEHRCFPEKQRILQALHQKVSSHFMVDTRTSWLTLHCGALWRKRMST